MNQTASAVSALDALTQIAREWVEALAPIMQAAADALNTLARQLGLHTRRGRRRWQKYLALRAHYARVAARKHPDHPTVHMRVYRKGRR